jgi:hypothetical protein
VSYWRDERNTLALARLKRALPPIFPQLVLRHALSQRFLSPTPRLAIESYWRARPIRADLLSRSLAARTGSPDGWSWRIGPDCESRASTSFRVPPAPFREKRFARKSGFCCVCGQPVFRLGWHRDLWADGLPNPRARWHSACVIAWKLWTGPNDFVQQLKVAQGRRCAVTGKRLLRLAEVDHRLPLYQVWRDHRGTAWPDLLRYWGPLNLQVINRSAHTAKCAAEARERIRVQKRG